MNIIKNPNQKGSAFIQAIIAIAVSGIILYTLSPWIIGYKTLAIKNSKVISSRLAIHSMLDYTLVGVKQKWCFSAAWTPEICGKDIDSAVTHPRSVERLLYTAETVNFFKESGVATWNQAATEKIVHVLDVSQITVNNPVYKIFQQVDGNIKKVKIEVVTDKNAALPQYGDEVYLRVHVSLLDASSKVVQFGASKLSATSYVGVYPREVGSFALIVANDLYLNNTANFYAPTAGDANFKKFASKTRQLEDAGLVFHSPVFVNSDIHLASEADKLAYTPVTFKEKVVLGAGLLRRDGKGFVPSQMSSSDNKLWSDIEQIGGFRAGVEVDGKKDIGLEYLSGSKASAAVVDDNSEKMMDKCISNTTANSVLAATDKSVLSGNRVKADYNKDFTYLLSFNQYNKFSPQKGSLAAPTVTKSTNFGLVFDSHQYENEGNGATLNYVLTIGDMKIQGFVPDNGSSILRTRTDYNQPIADLKTIISTDSNKIKDKLNQLQSLIEPSNTSVLNQVGGAIGNFDGFLQSGLQWNLIQNSVKSEDIHKVNALQSEIKKLQNQVIEQKGALNYLSDRNGETAQIKIEMDKVSGGGGGKGGGKNKSNDSYRNLSISFDDERWLRDHTGQRLNFSLQIEAYDVSYENFVTKRSAAIASTKNNFGIIDFQWDQNKNLIGSKNVQSMYKVSRGEASTQDLAINYDEECKTVDKGAFATATWSNSFSASSKLSWSFTNKYPDRTDYVFNIDNASTVGGRVPAFVIKSIAKNCIVESNATLVSGFLTCERLTIKARSLPLTIIGTFIVTNGLSIDASAYNAGINWHSVYHPMATRILRQAKILKPVTGTDCDSLPNTPVWHPRPSIVDRINNQQCNAIALRMKADPFRWTSVDPDCGLPTPTSIATSCKNKIENYSALEIHRESGI